MDDVKLPSSHQQQPIVRKVPHSAGVMKPRTWSRAVLAGPMTFITSALVMAGGAVWVPKGAASIDNIVLPILMFPAIWALLFFYACLDRQLLRAWLITLALLLGNAGLIAFEFVGKAGS